MVPGVGLEPTRNKVPSDFKSDASANSAIPAHIFILFMEAASRFELENKGFAVLCLTGLGYAALNGARDEI